MDAMLMRHLAMLGLELRTCQKVLTDGLVRSMQRIVLSKWVYMTKPSVYWNKLALRSRLNFAQRKKAPH